MAAPASADSAPPSTTPTITSPLDGAIAGGNTTISATSSAPTVQFYLDAAPFGAPVAVVAGTASSSWPTWGLANSGAHVWTAADCNGFGCNTTPSAAAGVTVNNSAPAVTAPLDGATTGPALTLQATSPGGGLAFFIDGVQIGFDATSPYSHAVAGPLANGPHSMFVQECNVAGSVCDGPTSGANFTVDTSPPSTTPTLTAPTNSSTVVGNVAISATSTAPFVQFSLDGSPFGSPVAIASGTASTHWNTWGLANGVTHTWTAADCNSFGCNATQSTTVSATIGNSTPAVTAPGASTVTGPSVTIKATAPGGGLAFFIGGTFVGFDGSSPYSSTVVGPLADGAHSTFVRECDTAGTVCHGPTSPSVSFTVKTLHPHITSVSPNPFSPNHDGNADETAFRIHLSDTEGATFRVENGNRQTVQGPHNLGTLGAGDHTYRWDGKTNASKIAAQGTYTIVVDTQHTIGSVTLRGRATAPVTIDNTPPKLSGATGNGATFYPVTDKYLDAFQPKVNVSEAGGLWMEIFNAAGTKVRVLSESHAGKGTFQLTWNGRTAGGSMVREGKYRYHFIARDKAGNHAVSPNFYVNVSHKQLVSKTTSLSQNGDAGALFTSDQSCTGYSDALSSFAHGVWLENVCDESYDDFQAIWANYSFAIPGAVRYSNIRVQSYGNTINAPEIIGALIYNFSAGEWDGVGAVTLGHDDRDALATYGTVSATGRVSASHTVKVQIFVPDTYPPEDYDIGAVTITVTYAVLQ